MLTLQEIRSSTKKELLHELVTLQKNVVPLRMGIKTKHQKDTSLAQKHKRCIAQILTVLKEQETV